MKDWKKFLYIVPDLLHRLVWKKNGNNWDEKLKKQFRMLYPATPAELETMVDEYRKKQIRILFFALVMVILLLVFAGNYKKESESIRIWRNGYGQGQKEESLLLENGETITFTVGAQEYTEEELEQAFQDGFAWVREQMLKENETAGEIRSELNFMTEVPGGFTAEWISGCPEVIGHDGQVFNQEWLGEKQEYVTVQLLLTYQDQIRSQDITFCVREPDHTPSEKLYLKIKHMILEAEESSREQDSFVIPGVIEGVALEQPEGNKSYGVFLLIGAGCVFLFFYQGNRMKDERKERHRQLEEDYPVLINKLVLYLGAGINLRKTFVQIAAEYSQDVQMGRMKKRYMYEELIVMVNEMSAGAGEQAAYEAFGSRMDNLSYTKLISLLVQNLQKGNDGLLNALKAEEANAFFLRIDHAKRLAEEAGTKLLFPMLLMLVVVMIIVMATALFQFGVI